MKLKTFIERPVLSIVISVAIVLLGCIALVTLPIEQFPNIAPPTVEVTTSYPGANAETVQKSVIVPLEEAINGVENMTYIYSTASNAGDVYITIYFKQGTDPDMAAVNVQNRVSKAQGQLPSDVTRIGVLTNKQQKSTLKGVTLWSPDDRYDMQFLNNYLQINVIPELKRINGVGEVTLLGSNYSMRIWLKPDVMAQYGIVPSDVTAALNAQNIESATGSFGENYDGVFQYTMKYKGRLVTQEEFGDIVIKSLPTGEILRLEDVARIQLGDEAYTYKSTTNGHPGSTFLIYQTAGSNASEVIGQIDAKLEEMKKDLPEGLRFDDVYSTKAFLDASMHQVIKTLFEAFLLVVIITYVFLQDVKSMIIPAISIMVSLVGTFAFMSIAGFSINLLTLFALVLAIGIVVDDAIIVVEAVQAKFDVGYKSSYMATFDAMGGITSTIITTTLVFMAVFIPVSMMGGTSGTFYMQFGLTMAAAVGISAINALTLSPALCALMLKPYLNEDGTEKRNFAARFRTAFNAVFSVLTQRYMGGVLFFIRKRWLALGILGCAVAALAWMMNTTKTGLLPEEDMGSVMVNVTMPPGSSLAQTSAAMRELEERIDSIPEMAVASATAGYGLIGGAGPSTGMVMGQLTDWSERKGEGQSIDDVLTKINEIGRDIPQMQLFAMAPPLIEGYGVANGFEIYLQDRAGGDINDLYTVGQEFIAALQERPEIGSAYTTFNVNFPQYLVEVDAAKCQRSGTTADAVLSTLAGYYNGQYVSNFNRFNKLYRVMIQSSPEYRIEPGSLDKIFTRVENGEMAPLSQFVKLTKVYGPESLFRFNLYSAMGINGEAAQGYSSGDAINAIRETADKVLPRGYSFEFAGLSREESQTTNNTAIIFLICTVFVYLILCGLYESFLVPFAVILAVPFGLMGSFVFAKIMGLENNIYMQTGLIMLIGLLAKTAILLTEYAADRRRAGMSLVQAALAAARVRFRPILMTVLAMIFGLLPLMFATGAGANGNSSLGSGVVGGMLFGILAILFFVPVFFILFQYLQEKVKRVEFLPTPDWEIQSEMEAIDERKKNNNNI